MTHTAFFELARQTAHAAINGSQPPALGGKLLTHLKVIAKGFVGDEVVTVDADTAEFLILAKTSASGAASLIDTTAVLNTSDPDEPQYEFEWNPADSIQLRAVLDAAADPTAPVELRYEFRFERSGNQGCIGGPIYFLNNYFRPETPAPDATADSSWTWLKARAPEANGFTHDDGAKTLAVEATGGSGAWPDITGKPSTFPPTLPIAQSGVTSLASDINALWNAVNGKLDPDGNGSQLTNVVDQTARDAAAAAQSTADGKLSPNGDGSQLTGITATDQTARDEAAAAQSTADGKLDANHASVTNARTPTGGAGGVLSGTYPNPGFAVDMATQTELDTVAAARPTPAQIHAAASKSTPVDADEIPLLDSAASFGVKRLTWANLRTNIATVLKTYFDTIYSAILHAGQHKSGGLDPIRLDELAAPTDVTTLDATVQRHGLLPKLPDNITFFLNGLGNYIAPPQIKGAHGALSGYTDPGSPAEPPPDLDLILMPSAGSLIGSLSVNTDQGTVYITISVDDPLVSSPYFWVNPSTFTQVSDYTNAIASILSSYFIGVASVATIGDTIRMTRSGTGYSSFVSVEASLSVGSLSQSGGGNGQDENPPSGEISFVDLAPATSGFPTKIIRAGYHGNSELNVQTEIGFWDGENFFRFGDAVGNNAAVGEIAPGTTYADLFTADRVGMPIRARIVEGESIPVGGSITFWALFQQ